MSSKEEPEGKTAQPSASPSATRPPPPSERRGPSMPPPPPRRSAKPAGPPPPPPSLPRGQRLAGIFSAPPPPPQPVAPAATAVEPPVAAVEAPPAAVEPPPAPPPAVDAAPPGVEAAPPGVEAAPPGVVEPPPVIEPPPVVEPPIVGPAPVEPAPPSVVDAPPSVLSSAPASVLSAPPPQLETPQWLVLARQRPVLWMAGLPVILASLLIIVLLALEPPRTAHPAPVASTQAPSIEAAPAVTPAPSAAPREDQAAKAAALANLEAKPSATLSVSELVLLSEGQAERKRADAQALFQKLEQRPDLAKDAATQTELMRLASDPDTARVALAAMAQIHSAIGADLLYEVWTSRTTPPALAELARSLLQSRDVRPQASPALASALVLRDANGCEAVEAALARAQSDGDRRSLPALAKLNSRRQCGKKTSADCADCARAQQKQVMSVIGKVKQRRPPTYPKG